MTTSHARARRIADAVLYEGYVLFPYRASARKNRYRWTFGVLMPRAWHDAGGGEPATMRLECLVESAGPTPPALEARLRFLQVERRQVFSVNHEIATPVDALVVDGRERVTWDEGLDRELAFSVGPCEDARLLDSAIEGRRRTEELGSSARVERVTRPLAFTAVATFRAIESDPQRTLWKLSLTVENRSPIADTSAPREEAVASALVGAHLVLEAREGAFLSLLDPPPFARAAVEGCENLGLFPVLLGEPGARALLFASPIALGDHPAVADESPGETCDGTEIDELLALSTRALGDDEKREARATDRRAAAIIDRADALSEEALLGLHGTRRETPAPTPHAFAAGSRVRVRLAAPTGARRTDAQDMFLDGRVGLVEEVREDLDGTTHIAVILEDDPAAEFHRWYGRHLHFRPEELELVLVEEEPR